MTYIPIQPTSSAEFLSTRGLLANKADADHFSGLLAGMKALSVINDSDQLVTNNPGLRQDFGSELFKDIHGLDKIMEGMDVASKLNSNAIHQSKEHVSTLSETLMRFNVDGTTYFMQTNYVNQRLGELDEQIKSVVRSK